MRAWVEARAIRMCLPEMNSLELNILLYFLDKIGDGARFNDTHKEKPVSV